MDYLSSLIWGSNKNHKSPSKSENGDYIRKGTGDFLDVPSESKSSGFYTIKHQPPTKEYSPGKPLKMEYSSNLSKSMNLDMAPLLIKKPVSTNTKDPTEIFNKILGDSENISKSIIKEQQKHESSMISQANPNINIDDWNDEIKEIHKYVEHKKDVLRSEWYYCTMYGKSKGMLSLTDGIIAFDPLKCSENNRYEDFSKFHWFIDLKDIWDAQIIKLPNESAQYIKDDKDRQCYIYDYYLQLALSTVDGKVLNRLKEIKTKTFKKNSKYNRSKSMSLDEFGENELDIHVMRKNSNQTKKCTLMNENDDNVFHKQSKKPAIAIVFFRFSHRDKDYNYLTNKQQEAIVDNIYQNIFYMTEHMEPHKNSSTKVPYYDALQDEDNTKSEYNKDILQKKARHFDQIHDKLGKDDWNSEECQKLAKLDKITLSMSIPTFSPFRAGESSSIISETQAIMISRLLPPVIRMREWERLFSVDVDGISLKTFYKNMHDHTATILLIQDADGWRFGGYAAHDWEVNKYFYGTGESFLFTFKDSEEQMENYKWAGVNDNIQYSDEKSIALGGDKGKHALYLRNYFSSGTSHKWGTFNNQVLASKEYFDVAKFEVWGFDWY